MFRPIRMVLIAWLTCAMSGPALQGLADQGTGMVGKHQCPSESVLVRIWTSSDKDTKENSYSVCSADPDSAGQAQRQIPATEPPVWVAVSVDQKKHDEAVYDKIAEGFRRKAKGTENSGLGAVLLAIERSRTFLPSWADGITASPDGRYAVLAHWGHPLLLVDVATLTTRRLTDKEDLFVTTASAWSPNSKHLAFTPFKKGQLCLYDVDSMRVTTTKDRIAPWVAAIAWSADGLQIAMVEWRNRRMDKNPFALLAASAGHPIFRNDAVLSIHSLNGNDHFSVKLKRGISEQSTLKVRVEWGQ